MPIELEIVSEDRRRGRFVEPAYAPSNAFESAAWWQWSRAKSPAAWCSFVANGDEVARAKLLFEFVVGSAYPTWTSPPYGATHVDLVAVRDRSRGQGVGRAAIDLVTENFAPPFTAFSRDDDSDRFWRSIGWREHLNEDHHKYPLGCQRLFTFGER